MRRPLSTFAMAALLALATGADQLDKMREKLLYPIARVSAPGSSGSGTVIYSEDRGGEQRTFVLTNWHVVDSAIQIVEEWDNLTGKRTQREKNEQVDVEIFTWGGGTIVDRRVVKADLYAFSKEHDLAVLELKSNERSYPLKVPYAAKLVDTAVGESVGVFTPVFIVGCGLGLDPTHTRGDVTDLEEMIDGKNYTQCSAPLIFGNSGGAVFADLGGEYPLIGVPARIAVSGGSGVTHLNWFVPFSRIRKFFVDQHLLFLTEDKATPAEADAARAKARDPKPPQPKDK